MESRNSEENKDNLKHSDQDQENIKPRVENQDYTELSAENQENSGASAEIPDRPKRSKTDPLNMQRPPLKDHSNPLIRNFAKTGYTIWIIVLAVGLFLAFVVSLFLV